MTYATEPIAKTLREARAKKGFSQRELSSMAGVPQGHISKIETGAVDLRLSSLVELARALDLELTLIPRNSVPAVKSIVSTTTSNTSIDSSVSRKELARLRNAINHLPRTLPKNELERLRRLVHELQVFPQLSQPELATIRNVSQEMKAFLAHPENRRLIESAAKDLQQLRNHLVHQKAEESTPPRPAYSLDDDNNA